MSSIQYLKCECGGTIAFYNRVDCKCDQCGKEYDWHKLDFDVAAVNPKTGWVFPVKYVDSEVIKNGN